MGKIEIIRKNDVKVNQIPPLFSSKWGKNVGKI